MRAFHSFWSLPNRVRNGGGIVIPDYELLTLMLSALEWQRHNGTIRLVTDSAGAAFFERAGLSGLWDGGIATALDGLDGTLDPALFWAAGKLEALRRAQLPCVMLDTDMVVWENVDARIAGGVTAAHREALFPDVYPDPRTAFVLDGSYSFPPDWDFTVPAANTAFLYMPDAALRDRYTGEAFRFMRALRGGETDPVVTMCFAEQRILPMCAQASGAPLRALLDEDALDDQQFVTHLWGHKGELADSPERRIEYCLRCTLRLLTDFPAWEHMLAQNGQTGRYCALLSSSHGKGTAGKENKREGSAQ